MRIIKGSIPQPACGGLSSDPGPLTLPQMGRDSCDLHHSAVELLYWSLGETFSCFSKFQIIPVNYEDRFSHYKDTWIWGVSLSGFR